MYSAKGENNNNEWYTPIYVIEKVRNLFGGEIDLDACSSLKANQRVLANNYYTKENSCLNREWNAENAFMNPPYSNGLINKCLIEGVGQYLKNNIGEILFLTNSGTDTKWNKHLQSGIQGYTNGRINFVYPDGTVAGKPSRGQVFTYFGNNEDKFVEIFSKGNFCWFPNLEYRGK